MDWFLADDAEHVTVAPAEADALADQYLWIPAADRLNVSVAFVVDVVDDDADFVDVAGEHDRRFTVTVDFGQTVARDVATHLRKFFGLFTPDLGGRCFET